MELVELSRRVNDGQVGLAIRTIQKALGGLEGVPVLVLGLTYRDGVKELAYSRALPLIERLAFHGAIVSAYDPLLSDGRDRPERARRPTTGERRATPGRSSPRPPIRSSERSTSTWFPAAEVLFDGRNSLRELALPERVAYHGVGRAGRDPPAGGGCRPLMRIASVVGTRPQLIKAAVLQPLLRARHDEIFIDTGQHYDDAMAGSFFSELGLSRPTTSSASAAGRATEQTAAMLVRLEPILAAERPDAVIVYGDTNSTLAGALAAAKLGLPVAHVEAGLRSFDRRMPEEVNRVVADHLATWAFAPTPTAVDNLAAEGHRRRRPPGRRPDAGPRGADGRRGPRPGDP